MAVSVAVAVWAGVSDGVAVSVGVAVPVGVLLGAGVALAGGRGKVVAVADGAVKGCGWLVAVGLAAARRAVGWSGGSAGAAVWQAARLTNSITTRSGLIHQIRIICFA